MPTDSVSTPTYLLVDGENIDATLGNHLLGGRRPTAEERPRWERVRTFAGSTWDQDVKAPFFLIASSGNLPMAFVQALMALDYRPIPLAGTSSEKVVDIGIQRTLDALVDRPGDVILASHDGDFLPHIGALLNGTRKVGVVGFREYLSSGYTALVDRGLQIFDLEDDTRCFTVALPRVRIIPLASFDPLRYL